jgi:hypothetical protein
VKPGIKRHLGLTETADLAAGRAELDGKHDLAAFEYIDYSAAASYADRNRRLHGHEVVGPFHNGQGWFCVIVFDDYAARHRRHDDQDLHGVGGAIPGQAESPDQAELPPADQAADHAGCGRPGADGA